MSENGSESSVYELPALWEELQYAVALLEQARIELQNDNPWSASGLLRWAKETIDEVDDALISWKYDDAKAIAEEWIERRESEARKLG